MSPRGGPSDPDASAWNVANAVTVLRLTLVPVVGGLLVAGQGRGSGWRVGAAGAFTVAAATDLLDGELARRRGLVTDFGTVADPIADKALIGTALVGLSALGELPWAVTATIMAREVAVTGLRLRMLKYGVIPASGGGKAKTVLQGTAIALYLLPGERARAGLVRPLRQLALALAVTVTLVTGVDYALRALRLRRAADRGGHPDGTGTRRPVGS